MVMFIWRVNTTLNRWAPRRVGDRLLILPRQRDCSGEKLEIDSLMSSVNSSSTTRDRLAKQWGIPTRCNCGEAVNRFTSKTIQNPGRLFHCCPLGSQKVSCVII